MNVATLLTRDVAMLKGAICLLLLTTKNDGAEWSDVNHLYNDELFVTIRECVTTWFEKHIIVGGKHFGGRNGCEVHTETQVTVIALLQFRLRLA